MIDTDGDILILDGATGTELDRRGVSVTLPLWSARALLEAPEVIEQIHADYLEAGAQAIVTNTFRTHRRSLDKEGHGERAADLTRLAVELARSARDRVKPKALILGSVAPLEDCYRPELSPTEAQCRAEHAETMHNLLDAGVDGLLIETMNTRHESQAAAESARHLAPGKWVMSFCTKVGGPPGVLLHGAPLLDVLPVVEEAWAVGINCVLASAITPEIELLRTLLPEGVRIAAYGNCGHADETGTWHQSDAIAPDRYAEYAREWIDAGATIIGGCCGTTPETIRAVTRALTA
ncbi:MAG: homocysteine S-methyltransferase family protein [Planctomycetes bacterium]|nr:homocysteine S-methyltransferase family protein [Planctomycetota bacterium]